MANIVRLNVRIPDTVRDGDLKALKSSVDALVPAHLKKPSQDDLVGILIQQAQAATVAQGVQAYYTVKNS